MKILIFSSTYDISGSSIRATMLARGLKENGHSIVIAGYQIPGYLQDEFRSYIFPFESHGESELTKAAIEYQPDWIIGVTEDSAQWAVRAAKIINCRCAIDLHAISIFEIIELGKGYGNRFQRIRNALKNTYWFLKCDLIITCSPNLHKLVSLLKGGKKTFDLTGLVEINNRSDPQTTIVAPKIKVLYVGNYYKWQGVDLYLDAAAIVDRSSSKYSFFILGSVGLTNNNKISEHPMVKKGVVSVDGPVPHTAVSRYLDSADVLVIPRPRLLSTIFGFPSKLCEYMAAGKIIIATNISPHRWALENPKCGILCQPNASGLADAILKLNIEEAAPLAETAKRIAVEKFDYVRQCAKLADKLGRYDY